MSPGPTFVHAGNYCGRFAAGWFGEPQNSFSNASFVAAALIGYVMWRRSRRGDLPGLALVVLAGSVGIGSYIFHSHPTPSTLQIDLIPIQVFSLSVVVFGCRRWFAARWPLTIGVVVLFGLANYEWARLVRGVLGGGAGHLLRLAAIAGCGGWLALRPATRRSGHFLLAAAATYTAAITVRAFDVPSCAAFPLGLHWVWHLIQGATVGFLLAAALTAAGARTCAP